MKTLLTAVACMFAVSVQASSNGGPKLGDPPPLLSATSMLQAPPGAKWDAAPLRMTHSTYEQPLPKDMAATTATGYHQDGTQVKGRWHLYPEMAAAGLWTTATDLAKFASGIQQSLAGTDNPVIPPAMTRRMLTVEKAGDGLGVFITGSGKNLLFSHQGRDDGFDTSMAAFAETGRGVVIMINANDDSHALNEIMGSVAKLYHWSKIQ